MPLLRWLIVVLVFGFYLATTSISTKAAPIHFSGQLDFVETDDGNGVYSATPLGTMFSGMIDDVSFSGSITNGITLTNFGCCIAAGGLEITNDMVLVEEDANFLNSILGITQYNAGDVIDGVDIEGDSTTLSGGRVEIGLSFLLHSDAFTNTDPNNYPFNPNDVEVALFFILEEDSAGTDRYSAGGLILSVPSPNSLGLFVSGLIGLLYLPFCSIAPLAKAN